MSYQLQLIEIIIINIYHKLPNVINRKNNEENNKKNNKNKNRL